MLLKQGWKKAIKVIRDIFEERKVSNANHGDYLDHLLEELKKEKPILNEAMAINFVFLLLFAAYESTSSAITLAVKFISDNPEVLAELTVCIFLNFLVITKIFVTKKYV